MSNLFFHVGPTNVRHFFAKNKKSSLDCSSFRERSACMCSLNYIMYLWPKAMKEGQKLSLLNRHPKTVVRIQFPDLLVLQGIFLSGQTFQDVEEFVRRFLVNLLSAIWLVTVGAEILNAVTMVSLYHRVNLRRNNKKVAL